MIFERTSLINLLNFSPKFINFLLYKGKPPLSSIPPLKFSLNLIELFFLPGKQISDNVFSLTIPLLPDFPKTATSRCITLFLCQKHACWADLWLQLSYPAHHQKKGKRKGGRKLLVVISLNKDLELYLLGLKALTMIIATWNTELQVRKRGEFRQSTCNSFCWTNEHTSNTKWYLLN